MNINKKTEYAKVYIDSIATHDDAPFEEVEAAIKDLAAHGQAALAAAEARRATAAADQES